MNSFVDLWPVAAEMALKSLALLAVAAVVALCLRKSSAARRHLLWAAAVAGLLLLPLLSIALSRTGVAVAAPMPTLPAASAPATVEPPASIPAPTAFADPAALTGDQVATAAASAPTVSAGFANRILALLPGSLVALWLAVGGLLLVRLSASHAAAWRLVRRAAGVDAGPLADALAEARRETGTARPVLLCVGMSEGGPVAPLMLGHRRPVILLPATAAEWTADRLRVVLLHELAHVRRRDWLWQMAAQVACSLYWFNPLVWLAARRLRAESEIASDDLVLTAGVPPADYAGHLLEIAGSLRSRSALPSAAVAMARKPEIHVRLQAILSGSRRIGLTRRAAAVACAASLAVVMFVAACRPAAVGDSRREQSNISLVGTVQLLPDGSLSWTPPPGGGVEDPRPYLTTPHNAIMRPFSPEDRARMLVVRIIAVGPEQPGVVVRADGEKIKATIYVRKLGGPMENGYQKYLAVIRPFDFEELRRMNGGESKTIEIGVAEGAGTLVASQPMPNQAGETFGRPLNPQFVEGRQFIEGRQTLAIAIDAPPQTSEADYPAEVVLVNDQRAFAFSQLGHEGGTTLISHMPHVRPEDVREIRLRERRYKWNTLENVVLDAPDNGVAQR